MFLIGCTSLSSDRRLLKEFEINQAAFEELAAALHRGQSDIPQTDLKSLGIVMMEQDSRWPGVVFFIVDEDRREIDSCETDIAEKGFAFFRTSDQPTVQSLEAVDGKLGAYFKPIGNGWHLYYKSLAAGHCE